MRSVLLSLLIGLIVGASVFLVRLPATRQDNHPKFSVKYTVEVKYEEHTGYNESIAATIKLPDVIKRRAKAAGYSGHMEVNEPAKEMYVILDGVEDVLRATELITRNDKIEFRELYSFSELAGSINAFAIGAEKFFSSGENKSESSHSGITDIIDFSNQADPSAYPNSPVLGRILRKDTAFLNRMLEDSELVRSFPKDMWFAYGPNAGATTAKDRQNILDLYAIRGKTGNPPIDGKYIDRARVECDFNKRPMLAVEFNERGSYIWEVMTRNNVGRSIGIVVNKKIISAPLVLSAITGGKCSVSGVFSVEELQSLAGQLNAGYISAHLVILGMEIHPEKTPSMAKNLLFSVLFFVVTAIVAFIGFKSLKRK